VKVQEVAGVVLDIEGTTSSVAFVYEVLFPYAREHLAAFLEGHWQDTDVVRARNRIARDAGAGSFAEWCRDLTPAGEQARLRDEVLRLMDRDAKATGLKELQGLIWRDGYAAGRLRSHVYDDVPAALRLWTSRGLDVSVYSSGSVTAQKLFFAHTVHGDLTGLLRGHYDTTTGPKKDPASYARIAADLRHLPAGLVFFSDVPDELDAARAAGWQTVLVVRPGNAPARGGHGHPEVGDFGEAHLRPAAERTDSY
jgi:enolase-phosphatase E1